MVDRIDKKEIVRHGKSQRRQGTGRASSRKDAPGAAVLSSRLAMTNAQGRSRLSPGSALEIGNDLLCENLRVCRETSFVFL
jgi:hypothetical protein